MCKCSWFRAKHNDQRCTSYKFWNKLFNRKLILFLWRMVYILWIQNSKISIYHRTTFYSIFNMSSCRKAEIQIELLFFTKKSSIRFISSCCNNYLIDYKNRLRRDSYNNLHNYVFRTFPNIQFLFNRVIVC